MGLSLGWEEGRQREPGLDSLGRGRRERKNSGVKTWCLGGGGGGVQGWGGTGVWCVCDHRNIVGTKPGPWKTKWHNLDPTLKEQVDNLS